MPAPANQPFCDSLSPVRWCLRIVVGLQCLGVAGRYLFSTMESESQIFEYLFFERGVSESAAQIADDVGAYGCLISAGVMLAASLFWALYGQGKSGGFNFTQKVMWWLEVIALQFVASWFLANALASMARREVYSEWVLGEIAVRFGAPIALTCLLVQRESNQAFWVNISKWILTLAAATTFLVHGYKAIQLYGPFTDLILLSDMNFFKFELEQTSVEIGLAVIGWLDIGLAVALVATRWRWIAAYMVFWGLVTAISRMTALGFAAWPETLVRSANWGAPLALLIVCSIQLRVRRTENSLPESEL